MTTKIYLVRHGETGWAESNRYAGRTDIPLTEKGFWQAERLAHSLKQELFDVCYASPLQRSMQTARFIVEGYGLEILSCPELREMDFGDWEGLFAREIQERYPDDWSSWEQDPAVRAPLNGESGYQLAVRAVPALYKIVQAWKNRSILVVAHKTVNRIILAHLMDIPIRQYRQQVLQETSALNVIFENNGIFHVERVNDVSHLE